MVNEKVIVIIEDEKMLAEMYGDKLKRSGFKIYSALDAEEGLELIKEIKPNLVLLDILLPRENGVSLLAKVRKVAEIASVPVIVFSNYDDGDTKKQAGDLGAKEYLIKTNYTPQEIVEKIREYL